MADFEYKTIELSRLIPAAYNPRQISEKEQSDLMRSMKEFGVVEPLVVQKKLTSVPEQEGEGHRIIGGHQRYNAACDLRLGEVPCIVLDIDDSKAKLLNIALNKIHGHWDMPKLADLICSLGEEMGEEVTLSGFGDDEIEGLLSDYGKVALSDDDVVDKYTSGGKPMDGVVFRFGAISGYATEELYHEFAEQFRVAEQDTDEPLFETVLKEVLSGK